MLSPIYYGSYASTVYYSDPGRYATTDAYAVYRPIVQQPRACVYCGQFRDTVVGACNYCGGPTGYGPQFSE